MKTFTGHIVRPSTRSFAREARATPGYSLFDFLHGYFYSRWPYLYIAIGTGEHRLARLVVPFFTVLNRIFAKVSLRLPEKKEGAGRGGNGQIRRSGVTFADTYHGKVVPLKQAAQLVMVNRDVALSDLEHVIPFAIARDIVLKNPDHIVALQCPCRTARKNPCKPLDVCLIVGEPFATFVTEHHRDRSHRVTPAEAVEILRAEDERGHVHHAFFKDAMLGRFYAICNCCKCCCGAMQAHRGGIPMLASSGYMPTVDRTLCVSCGTCAKYCQFEAVGLIDGVKTIDETKCMGCGVCVAKCRQNALSLVREPSKGVPLEIHELMAAAIGELSPRHA